MMDMIIGYVFAAECVNGIGMAIAWCPTGNTQDITSQAYKADPDKNMTDAIEWAVDDWCKTMNTRRHRDCVLFVEADCAPADIPARVHEQNVIYGVNASRAFDKDHPFYRLYIEARKKAVRLPAQIRSVINDAVASYDNLGTKDTLTKLEHIWPATGKKHQMAVYNACVELDREWRADNIEKAHDAATRLSAALDNIFALEVIYRRGVEA